MTSHRHPDLRGKGGGRDVSGKGDPRAAVWIILDRYPETSYRFPILPVRTVESVVCVQEDGTEVGLTGGTFRPTADERLVVDAWPEGTPRTYDAVTITVTAGTEVVPARWKQAMLLLIGHWYEHRESVTSATS